MADVDVNFAFTNAPIGLVVTRYRLIQLFNQKFAEIFGFSHSDLSGKSIALLYPSSNEFVEVGKLGLKAMSVSGRYSDERIMQRADGTHFWCRVHGTSTTPKDPYAHCVWSFLDISDHRPLVQLTRREREIAMFVVDGQTNKQIARHLRISHRTVEAHRSRMMRKLRARNTAELLMRLAGLPAQLAHPR